MTLIQLSTFLLQVQILQITYQTQFEENNGIDALLAAFPIIDVGKGVEKI